MTKSTAYKKIKKHINRNLVVTHIYYKYRWRLRLYYLSYLVAFTNLSLIMISEDIGTVLILIFCFILSILLIIFSYLLCRRYQIKYFNGKRIWTLGMAMTEAYDIADKRFE